jgi:voltage-dependent calcium channel L type alpha-1D
VGGNDLLTDKQKEWIETRLLVLRSTPIKKLKPPSENRFRTLMFRIQERKEFENFIFVCIIINSLILTLKWYMQPPEVDTATDIINYLFTFIFTLEAFIKIVGLGKIYFHDTWNIFDFIVVLGSFGSIYAAR